MLTLQDRYRGLMLGTAVGDAVGLPAEGIPRTRAKKRFKGVWRHRLLLNWGMISDDTEHTLFVIQSLLAHADDPDRFIRRLAFCLRWWLASLPAGIGMATGKAIFRLWFGFSPRQSGVFSAGNGPAMRVAPLGAYFCDDMSAMDDFTARCTRITHTDPKAEVGAKAIAHTAAWIVRKQITVQPSLEAFLDILNGCGHDEDWQRLVGDMADACRAALSVEAFAAKLGLKRGVTGYIYHTVPVVLFAWYRHCGDFEKSLTAIWDCGGDTDTTGAILGSLAGLTVGEGGIPVAWIDGILEWPRSVPKLRQMADALARKREGEEVRGPVRYFWPGVMARNMLFLLIVLLHGFRRLLPPY